MRIHRFLAFAAALAAPSVAAAQTAASSSPNLAVSLLFALIGGLAGLILRDMSFSIPAAVGFIALAGVAVLNGVVLASEVRGALEEGHSFDEALLKGSSHTMRAVLTTGAVAALGFLPMALATGAGSEVRRAMGATVFAGMIGVTLFGLLLTPVFYVLVRRSRAASASAAALPAPIAEGSHHA